MNWYVVDLDLEPQACEAAEYALMEAGALGTENSQAADDRCRVSAYFDRVPEREDLRDALFDALRIYDLPSSAVREMQLREIADKDWLADWKKSWQPVAVGERFIVAPPWSEVASDSSRILIRIEPGMAFGTGTHETTRLCLKAIEKHFQGGSFLDVGTGTGILAIAAAKLFPSASIAACDTDPDAIKIARENAALNGVAEKIDFRVGTITETDESADVVCANLTADVILASIQTLLGSTCRRLILSGILDTQTESVLASLREHGIERPLEVMNDGEWVAVVV